MVAVTRTLVELPDELVPRAMELTGALSKKAMITRALAQLVNREAQLKMIDWIQRGGLPGLTDPDALADEWTLEAAADLRRIVRDPDPKSRSGAVRIIGFSPSAGFVITVIATRTAHAGVTAWKSSGADLREYEGQGAP